ncbi:terminase large subunit [Brachyspira hyodysenteriae]|uniref:terminase large subunit n=1 Tax=Brachyspira hyodysenteriae TaxID=159 RepID=UPI00063DC3C2|nr:terminase TerL endonuclease subunit [Brachyspira hyodysenteriae]KLI22452.1 terminase [Brachyspira hyodysenteriae]TVL62726.1 terminase [Brachyspira hyodysenteriae]TVL80866.1 terminase [Brachyspira hyodysenteriae]TVL83533.1 terminase [Brachyspira hyodysenteriae]
MYTYKEYINKVINKELPVCQAAFLSVKRHLDDIEKSKNNDYPFYFDDNEAKRPIMFIQSLVHTKGEWANHNIILESWEQFIIASIFGWRRKENKLRRYKKAYVQVSRKNGKTTFASGIGNYCFFCDSPAESGVEIYYIATKKDQAKIAWSESERQIRKAKALNKEAITYKQTSTITKKKDTASKSKPLGQDSNTEDGLNPHLVIVDEYHAHPDNELLNVLESGMGARRQPLIFIITTAGFDKSSVCFSEYEYAKKILDGSNTNEEYFTIIYEPDDINDIWVFMSEYKEKLNKNEDISKQEKLINKIIFQANPNINVSVKDSYLKSRLLEGLDKPIQRTDILTKNLNVWTQASEVWISSDRWIKSYLHQNININELKGRKACIGLDLATTRDIAAYVLCFDSIDNGPYILLPRFFMPKENIRQRSKEDRVPYELWASQGLITLTNGDIIDFDVIESSILNDARNFEIIEIAYDPWKAIEVVTHLKKEGFKMTEIRQSFAVGGLSEGTSLFEKTIDERKLLHGDNAVLNWMISCCEARTDGRDNYLPTKPDRRRSYKRIDGVVASIMALHRVIKNHFEDTKSIYESEGVFTL